MVITGLTRNQFEGNLTWVRIPPAPPTFKLIFFILEGFMPNIITHPIPPVFSQNSRILILGSFPSIKSRETMFFYGHPQNRFWQVLAVVFEHSSNLSQASIKDKKSFLLQNHIALWDVIASCNVCGSSDSSINNVKANDISVILNSCNIKQIFVNGRTAAQLYKKLILPHVNRAAIYLPSTSSANAAWSLPQLVNAWSQIKSFTI